MRGRRRGRRPVKGTGWQVSWPRGKGCVGSSQAREGGQPARSGEGQARLRDLPPREAGCRQAGACSGPGRDSWLGLQRLQGFMPPQCTLASPWVSDWIQSETLCRWPGDRRARGVSGSGGLEQELRAWGEAPACAAAPPSQRGRGTRPRRGLGAQPHLPPRCHPAAAPETAWCPWGPGPSASELPGTSSAADLRISGLENGVGVQVMRR